MEHFLYPQVPDAKRSPLRGFRQVFFCLSEPEAIPISEQLPFQFWGRPPRKLQQGSVSKLLTFSALS